MSKTKDVIDDIRNKVFERKKQEVIEETQKNAEAGLETTTYDVIQNPDTKSRSFLIIKLKYDIKTKKAAVVDVLPFSDKTAGLSIQMNKDNIKFLYEKNRRGVKNENE